MPLVATTDHPAITAAIDSWVTADPVRATALGTIRDVLEDTAWAMFDGDRMAVRSGAGYPLQLIGDWSAVGDLVAALRELPDLAGVAGPVEPVRAVLAVLRPGTDLGPGQRLFRCDELVPPSGVPGSVLVATPEHRELLHDWYTRFFDEADDVFGDPEQAADRSLDRDVVWLWVGPGGEPVSVATQRRPVSGSARVGPVYTPPAERGNGYGSAVTAAATRAILDAGAVPVLFTELANPTSNKIYQQLGYRPVEDRAVAAFR